jgi:hypothetical protein
MSDVARAIGRDRAASTRVATASRPAPTPPPVYRPPVVPPSRPAAKPSATLWIVMLLGVLLITIVVRSGNRSPEANPVAIPGQPSSTPVPQREVGVQQITTMPDGNTVPTTFKGILERCQSIASPWSADRRYVGRRPQSVGLTCGSMVHQGEMAITVEFSICCSTYLGQTLRT